MRSVIGRIFCATVFCLPLAMQAAAQKGYVSDKLEVPLRSGPGTQQKTLKLLPSGTALSILDQNGAAGFSRVKLDSGEEGWLPTRFLSAEPVARTRLESIIEENRRLSAELAASRPGSDGGARSIQQAEIERLKIELIAVRQASANVLQIQDERDRLHERVIHMEGELETLRREKHALDGDYRQDWFLIGAGVLFGGVLLGVFLPRLSWRKKAHWESF